MGVKRRFEVIFEGRIVVDPQDALHDVGLQVAEALGDGDRIEDPFVRTDTESGRFRVEVTVVAADEAEAFDTGVREISEALRSVVGLQLEVQAPSAQTSGLVPA